MIDGDIIEIRGERVRFNGIDAPESWQGCEDKAGREYRCGKETAESLDTFLAAILDLTENHPRIARALWWTSLVDEAILRDWLTNVGQRPAVRRIAHLLCEMLVRLEAVGLVADSHYELPLTQTELGETMGLSAVHVNRVLKELREQDLVRMTGKTVWIPNIDALKAFGEFNPNYLHYGDARRNRQRKVAGFPAGPDRG